MRSYFRQSCHVYCAAAYSLEPCGVGEGVRNLIAHILCRLKWTSGQAFAGRYDEAPTQTNATQFLRVDGNSIVIDCKK